MAAEVVGDVIEVTASLKITWFSLIRATQYQTRPWRKLIRAVWRMRHLIQND